MTTRARRHEREGRRVHGGVLGLFVLLFSSACVLLAPPIDHGPDCQLNGSSTCGTCLREECQAAINECCDDSSCRGDNGIGGALSDLDTCAEGNVDACASWVDSSYSKSFANVRNCLVTSCNDSCLEGATVPVVWSCEAPREPSTKCGKCIYDKCASSVEACCEHGSCSTDYSDIAREMGACVGGDDRACVRLNESSMEGTEGALRMCVIRSCGAACFPEDGRAHTRCSLHDGGSYCSCTYAAETSGVECSAAKVKGSACVEGRDGCSCGTYGCEWTGGGTCTCDLRASAGDATSCAGEYCCVRYSGDTSISCTCGTEDCSSDGNLVPSCDEEDVHAELRRLKRLRTTCSN